MESKAEERLYHSFTGYLCALCDAFSTSSEAFTGLKMAGPVVMRAPQADTTLSEIVGGHCSGGQRATALHPLACLGPVPRSFGPSGHRRRWILSIHLRHRSIHLAVSSEARAPLA